MDRLEKLKLAITKGYIYEPITGNIINRYNKLISSKKSGYIFLQIIVDDCKYIILGHQFAWYFTYGEIVDCIDHINGIKDDNRISNLRSITHQQNHFNRTTAKGYHWNKYRNKWQSKIRLNGKDIHLGLFTDESEARKAYLDAKKIYHII